MPHHFLVRDTGPTTTEGRTLASVPTGYVHGIRGRYTHIPRSAHLWYPRYRRTTDRITVQTWCGQLRHDPTFVDGPTPTTPLCGTCAGRAAGASPTQPALIFRPRGVHTLTPRWCPGPNLGLYVADAGHALCLCCGHYGTERTYGWNGYPRMNRHEHHGAGLACPHHGWQRLALRDGHVVCTYHRCDGTPRPFWHLHDTPRPQET